jgi:hypothetical protein
MTREILRFDTSLLYDALDVDREQRGWAWSRLATELRVAAATLTRAAAGGRMAGDNAAMFVDWLGLPHEAFLRRQGSRSRPDLAMRLGSVIGASNEVSADVALGLGEAVLKTLDPSAVLAVHDDYRWDAAARIEASPSPDGFTRIDSFALRRALDAERSRRGLTWQQIAIEIRQPDVVSASSLAAIGSASAPRDTARKPLGMRVGAQPFLAVTRWLRIPSEAVLSRPPGRVAPDLRTQLLNLVRLERGLSA